MTGMMFPICPQCGGGWFRSEDMDRVAKDAFMRKLRGEPDQALPTRSIQCECLSCGHKAPRNEVYTSPVPAKADYEIAGAEGSSNQSPRREL